MAQSSAAPRRQHRFHFLATPLTTPDQPHLERRFGLLPATALNMTNMMGAGPFITIPLLMTALGGPQAMLGWIVALVIVICDGMVWSELGAAMPGSGGSFRYLREAFGRERFGRLIQAQGGDPRVTDDPGLANVDAAFVAAHPDWTRPLSEADRADVGRLADLIARIRAIR